jgi:hypothetical protein
MRIIAAILFALLIAGVAAEVPLGAPLLLFSTSYTATGYVNFTQAAPGIGSVGGAALPTTFSVDVEKQQFVFLEPVTAQYTYANGTYTILPSFDANGNLVGFGCFYDPSFTYQHEVTFHMVVEKVGQVLLPACPANNKRDVETPVALAKPGQATGDRNDPYNRSKWRLSSNFRGSRGSACGENNNGNGIGPIGVYDQYFGATRDVGSADGRLGYNVFLDPNTGYPRKLQYSGTNIQPFQEACPCCQESEIIGTGYFEFTEVVAGANAAALALNPICYGATIPYASLGCHI